MLLLLVLLCFLSLLLTPPLLRPRLWCGDVSYSDSWSWMWKGRLWWWNWWSGWEMCRDSGPDVLRLTVDETVRQSRFIRGRSAIEDTMIWDIENSAVAHMSVDAEAGKISKIIPE